MKNFFSCPFCLLTNKKRHLVVSLLALAISERNNTNVTAFAKICYSSF